MIGDRVCTKCTCNRGGMDLLSSIDAYLDAQTCIVDALGSVWDEANKLAGKYPEVNEVLTHLRKLQYRLLQKETSLRLREIELKERECRISGGSTPGSSPFNAAGELVSDERLSVMSNPLGPLHCESSETVPPQYQNKVNTDTMEVVKRSERSPLQPALSCPVAPTHLDREDDPVEPILGVETSQPGSIVASSWDGLIDLSLLEDDSLVCLSGEGDQSSKSICDALGFKTAENDLTDEDRQLMADILTPTDETIDMLPRFGGLRGDTISPLTAGRPAESATPVKRKQALCTTHSETKKKTKLLWRLDSGQQDAALPLLVSSGANEMCPSMGAILRALDPHCKSECVRRLEVSRPAVQKLEGYIDCQDRPMPRPSVFSHAKTIKAAHATVQLAEGWEFHVLRCLGRGAYGKTFKVKFSSTNAAEVRIGVIKLQSLKSGLWEYYIRHALASRSTTDGEYLEDQLSERECERAYVNREELFARVFGDASDISKILSTVEHPSSIVAFERFFAYKADSVILMPFCGKYHLQDVANTYHVRGRRMPEVLVCLYALQLLERVAALHRADILHGDVKPDNFMVLHGGSLPRLILIDFGNCVDLRMYSDTLLTGDHQVEGFHSPQAICGLPYRYQADLAGVCGIIHFLLHGQVMKLMQDRYTDMWTPTTSVKRYHRFKWDRLFCDLLNREDEANDSSMHRMELGRFLDGNVDELVGAAEEQRRLLAGS